jgi:hypothetical protein
MKVRVLRVKDTKFFAYINHKDDGFYGEIYTSATPQLFLEPEITTIGDLKKKCRLLTGSNNHKCIFNFDNLEIVEFDLIESNDFVVHLLSLIFIIIISVVLPESEPNKSQFTQPDLFADTSEEKLFILDLLKLNKSIKIDDEKFFPEASVINIIKQVIKYVRNE